MPVWSLGKLLSGHKYYNTWNVLNKDGKGTISLLSCIFYLLLKQRGRVEDVVVCDKYRGKQLGKL